MKRLLRLAIISVIFVVATAFFYCVFPSLVWILGGNFLAVLHFPVYVLIGGLGSSVIVICNLIEEFDADFYVKNKTKKK